MLIVLLSYPTKENLYLNNLQSKLEIFVIDLIESKIGIKSKDLEKGNRFESHLKSKIEIVKNIHPIQW